jgi:chromosomal replication initiation ATPase DnaA
MSTIADNIIEHAARLAECTPEEVLGHDRTTHIADARAVCAYVLRKHHSWTFQRIADHFGQKSHASAASNVNKVENHLVLYTMAGRVVESIKKL